MGDAWNALADPTRRRILKMLRKRDMNAGEIADEFEMTKPSISHHLTVLKQAGLVESEKSGQNQIYSINTSVLEDVMSLLASLTERREEDKYE